MRLEDQTEEAFQEDFGVTPQTSEPKGKGYIELLVDNIVGLDNEYESFGEAFGKSFNEDELGTLKNMAVSAYEGAKKFATSPIETTKDIATEISDSVSRLGAESLDGRIKRMYGVGYQDATEEQVTKAREAVIGDAITASSLVPAAKGVTTVAKAAIPGKVQADVVGQMRSLLDGDREFRTESKNPPVGLSAQATGAVPSAAVPSKPKSQINPLFKPRDTEDPNLVSFYSPLVSAIGAMDIGANGKSGRDIMAYLNKRAPNVSKGELQFSRLNLDPDKKYSREELLENLDYSLEGTVAKIRSGKKTLFKGQQIPKNYVDKPTDYFEITLDAKALPGKVNTHFGPETLAHSRTTAHVDASGEKYFVLNELQSDALQNVGKSFSVPDPVENVGDMTAFLALDARVGYNSGVFDFFEKEALKPTLDKAALKEAYKNTFGITAEGRDVGQIHKDALRKAVDSDISEGDLNYLESKIDYALRDFANYQAELKQAEAGYSSKDIPFESTSAYVKNLLLANIARAKQEGVNKLVIPNLDEIARLRAEDFEGGFEAAKKALRPTYENAVKKAVNTLNSEYGNKIKVGTRNLEYKDLTEKSGKRTSAAKELDITDFNFDPATQKVRFAEGGMVEDEQMNKLMQEGGIADDGMTREPVTGNEIPPGSMASEVRDDIPAQLSEGEYVVPADVVRFFGVRFFEDLRSQAKQGLQEMDADGRIGGTPVDAQGVPVGGQDEELTPEEEQMLMEVLGSSGAATGMAYGGMAQNLQQPMSNPYQDQSTLYQPPKAIATAAPALVGMAEGGSLMGQTFTGFESRRYYNPETKQEMTINFLDGRPLGMIPTGFVPWSAELVAAEVKPVEPEVPEGMGAQDGDRGRDEGDAGADGDGSAGYRGWAEKNAEAINSDPLGFGMSALEGKQGFMSNRQMAGLAGMVNPALGIGVMGASAISGVQNIAEARAAVEVAKAKGLNTDALEARINEAVEALPGAVRSLTRNGVIGDGSGYTEALSGAGAAASARTGTGIAAGTPATKGQDKGVGVGYGVGQVDPGLDRAAKDRAAGEAAVNKALEVGRGIQGNRAADKALADKAEAQAAKEKAEKEAASRAQGDVTRRAEGGLIGKPQKTSRNKKGLAS